MARLQPHVPRTVEFRVVRPDGEVRLLQARALVVPGADGGPGRVLGTSLDITERRATELALRASEESYRTIFDASHDAIFVHDVETGAVLDANRQACVFSEASLDELRRDGLAILASGPPPFTRERAADYLRRAAAGESVRFEWLSLHRRTGAELWMEVSLQRVAIRGEARLLALARDIGDRKAAEAALRSMNEALEQRVADRTAELAAANTALAAEVAEHAEARAALGTREEHFRRLIENTSDFVMVIDPTAAITYLGPSAPRILGWEVEEMLGTRPDDLVHPDDVAYVYEQFRWIVEHPGEPLTLTFRIRHKDGTYRWFENNGRTLSPHTADEGVVGFGRDVTDRKAVEEALQRSEEYFRALIENGNDIILTCDTTGRVTYVSPSVRRLLGLDPASLLGKTPGDLMHPEDVPEAEASVRRLAAAPGEVELITYRVRDGQGEWRLFESINRTLLPDSADAGIVCNARDITAQRAAERALRRATTESEQAREEAERQRSEAERANRAKSDFLSRMSHELRTPMNSILGFAQLLGRAELSAQQAKGVHHILKAGRHLLHLINEVLEISRIEAGRESFSIEPVALGAVLREVLGLVRPLAQQRGVQLADVWCDAEAYVHADRQRLVQVLLNLLSNAIKYNRPHGEVRVGCAPVRPGWWAVRIEDEGPGIPADRVDQLFTPFARLGAEQTEVEGTGLGLALSQRLSEAMGGALTLESTGPAGSVFRVEFAAADDPLRTVEEAGALPAAPARVGAATILYVEDNLANLALVETILLSRPGWRTIPALQGHLGVELAREHLPDVVLLDLHLPDISGDEVLRRLRADARTAAIPVIVVSADATPASLDRLGAAGANAYLTKPLDVDAFLAAVERFLPAREDGAAGGPLSAA
jgi:PAS domain S-box-containing protein